MREVAGAITSATITTVAVFLPIALVEGLVGELFRPFSLTFTIALVASLLVSLTIVPVLAYWFLKSPKGEAVEKQRELEEARERRSWLQRGYLPVLRGTQRHPVVTLLASILVLGFTFSLVPLLKTNFIGNSDSTTFVVNQELPAGSSLSQKDAAAAKLETLIMNTEGVEVVQTTIGSTGDGRVAFGASAGGIQLQVTTKEKIDQEALRLDIQERANADASLGEVQVSAGGGGGFGSSSTVDIELAATTDEGLREATRIVEEAMQGVEGVSEVSNSLQDQQRTLQIQVKRKAAAKQALTEIQIATQVAAAMQPNSIGRINLANVETPIYVIGNTTPASANELANLELSGSTGTVKLKRVAELVEVTVPVRITSEKGFRTAEVSLTPVGDDLGAITAEVTKRLEEIELPLGVTANLGGISADQAESFSQLGLALLAAIAIVYIVMVATFSSIVQPILLLVSIPFAATGALSALLITDTPLGVPALIGMLLLVGVVVTNAIVLIDLINQYRKQGKSVQESIMDGARQRLRPILMTALATIFALTPMALGITGGGGFISQPLAIVVIGGLFSSTILTLIIVPVLYWLVEGRKERKAIRAFKREAKASEKSSGDSASKTKRSKRGVSQPTPRLNADG